MARVTDVTCSEVKLAAALKRLSKSKILLKDKEDIEDFYFSMRRANLEKGTQLVYINTLKRTCELYIELGIDKPLREVKLRDFDKFLVYLEEKQLKEGTINQYKKALRKFMKWVYGKDVPSWVLTEIKLKKVGGRIQPEDIPTRKEFTEFLEGAKHPRDQAIIAIAGDAAVRISAILSCTIGSFVENEHAAILYLSREGTNKTTPAKGIPLTWSTAYIQKWLTIHPFRDDPKAPLWTTLRKHRSDPKDKNSKLEYTALSYESAYQMFLEIEERLNQNKHTHPHTLRHYAVTNWIIEGISEQIIKHRAGWGPDSKEMERYGNWRDEDLNQKIFEIYGLKTENVRSIELKKCPRCNNILKPEDRFCSKCSLVLDQSALKEVDLWKDDMSSRFMKLLESEKFKDIWDDLSK